MVDARIKFLNGSEVLRALLVGKDLENYLNKMNQLMKTGRWIDELIDLNIIFLIKLINFFSHEASTVKIGPLSKLVLLKNIRN